MKAIHLAIGCLLMGLITMVTAAMADVARPAQAAAVTRLLDALARDEYPAFVAQATPRFRQAITRETFAVVARQVGESLRGGYQLSYLTDLRQGGETVYLWKVTYPSSGMNNLARLVLDGDRVAGFWLH